MANFNTALVKGQFDSILPEYGKPRRKVPVWDDGRKMFICDEYESAAGNRYYKGVRFCENLVVVEKVGEYHNFTYLDGIEIYAFDGQTLKLVQKREYDKQFRSEDFVREESVSMLEKYLESTAKMMGQQIPHGEVENYARKSVNKSFKSLLDDDYPAIHWDSVLRIVDNGQ